MCGIHGVLFPLEDCSEAVQAMHAALSHRGPDGDGIERFPAGILGHRRLSIIDLSPTGAQPMWNATGQVCITFNGEIYNYRELRAECGAAGLPFRGPSDTEVILNLYLLHGERCFERLNGIFAFCLFDSRTSEFWLVRDPMGIKPLYYGRSSRGLFFASELGAMLATGEFPFQLDQTAVQAYLRLDYVPSPWTPIVGISKLTGGQALRVTRAQTIEQRYTTVGIESGKSGDTLETALRRFDDLMHRVVERQMISDVPLGVFLSGGVDSTIVTAIAAELRGKIPTFSIAFEDPTFDERRYFERVARTFGTDQHTEMLTPDRMIDLFPIIPSVTGEPLADGSIFPTLLLSRFTRKHVTVSLSGDGADELFAGYPTHRVSGTGMVAARLPGAVRRWSLSALENALKPRYANFSLDFKLRKFLSGVDRDPVLQNQRWLGTFSREELPGLLHSHDPHADDILDVETSKRAALVSDPLDKLLRTDQRFYMQDQVLVKVDRASMSPALEVRVPFLDNEMVRFANSLPSELKLGGGQSKRLLRQWLNGRVPEEIWRRPKKGFGVPLGQWFRGPLRPMLDDVLLSDRNSLFDKGAVRGLLDDHYNGRRDERKKIFNLLSFVLWHEHARQLARPRQLAETV
jgi:asparagine synthase (glutamine-hydrolysing)